MCTNSLNSADVPLNNKQTQTSKQILSAQITFSAVHAFKLHSELVCLYLLGPLTPVRLRAPAIRPGFEPANMGQAAE